MSGFAAAQLDSDTRPRDRLVLQEPRRLPGQPPRANTVGLRLFIALRAHWARVVQFSRRGASAICQSSVNFSSRIRKRLPRRATNQRIISVSNPPRAALVAQRLLWEGLRMLDATKIGVVGFPINVLAPGEIPIPATRRAVCGGSRLIARLCWSSSFPPALSAYGSHGAPWPTRRQCLFRSGSANSGALSSASVFRRRPLKAANRAPSPFGIERRLDFVSGHGRRKFRLASASRRPARSILACPGRRS